MDPSSRAPKSGAVTCANPADGHDDQAPTGVKQYLERLEERNDVDEEWLKKKLKTLPYPPENFPPPYWQLFFWGGEIFGGGKFSG